MSWLQKVAGRKRWLILPFAGALAAWAVYWYAFGVPPRPSGVSKSYAFVRLNTGQVDNRGVWIGCKRDPKQWDLATCRIIGQRGHKILEAQYRSYPPGTLLPLQPLRPSRHTDWYEGVGSGPQGTGTEYEPFIWLRGCILLLPSDAYKSAQAKFKEDQAGAAGLPPQAPH